VVGLKFPLKLPLAYIDRPPLLLQNSQSSSVVELPIPKAKVPCVILAL
jgi:hypothetical protein